MESKIRAAKVQHDAARTNLERACEAVEALPDDATDAQISKRTASMEEAAEEFDRTKQNLENLELIAEARRQSPPMALIDDNPIVGARISVGHEASTYRPDTPTSFFRDLVKWTEDPDALQRLQRHQLETRDVTTGDPGASGFVPPIYLGQLWAESARGGRPFADIVPKFPMPDVGTQVSIPKVQTATTTAVQTAENTAVSEADIDGEVVTANLCTIAGQNDVSLQALERTFPGLDQIVFADLMADYDEQLDTQLLEGSGSSGQHRGIRNVTGKNTVTYTDASPTGAELLPKIYNGIEQVATNRLRNADTIVMHPRRAAWLGKELSTSHPLFSQGGMPNAVGTQNGGFVSSFGGLRVVLDPNLSVTRGSATNEDEIMILRVADLVLMESGVRARVFPDVLSSTLTVRLQVYGYSFFVPHRWPAAITVLSGTGLTTPLWT